MKVFLLVSREHEMSPEDILAQELRKLGLDNSMLHSKQQKSKRSLPLPVKAIFNDPATILYWGDGTKTVVKCQPGDTYNREVGLMAAMLKYYMGNDGAYNNILRRYLNPPQTESTPKKDCHKAEERSPALMSCDEFFRALISKLSKSEQQAVLSTISACATLRGGSLKKVWLTGPSTTSATLPTNIYGVQPDPTL